ncbi:hypothetical protein U1Q18_031044 [Sarracenia purpurea var. burkii]
MECNKEEAIRAKEIAEKKMKNKDFFGARKIALKAQQLYPDLENISQMIMVCDVHCSAENKVYGNEKDWYGILKIEATADEASIKKQYKKFALLLHPDKNNFAGATDAFQLIGEAQGVLLDRGKRMLYDSKWKTSRPAAPNWGPQPGSSNSTAGKQPWVQNNYMSKFTPPNMGYNPQYQQPQRQSQPVFPNGRPTFWTVCTFCSTRYQFYREVINKLLYCQSCKRTFSGYEVDAQDGFLEQKDFPRQAANTQGTFERVDAKINKGGVGESKSSRKVNGKRRKQAEESSESHTGSSSDSDEDIDLEENGDGLAKQKFGCYGEKPRRSTRSKTRVSYDENLNDDDDLGNHSKRSKCGGSVFPTEDDPSLKESFSEGSLQNGKEKNEKENGEITPRRNDYKRSSEVNGESSMNRSPIMATDQKIYEYPDSEFYDFDNDRRKGCFAVGQTWALYDTLDAMPRFYARIRRVFSPGFKLRITWLEPNPDVRDEIKWVEQGLPVSCGKFKHGHSEYTEDHAIFSHLVHWEKGSVKDTYVIYPRRGETWALFKNWDIKWQCDRDSGMKYEFEFVEVLTDCAEGIGVSVAYLGKVKGFSCLFCRTTKGGLDSFQIPPKQLFRFSHRVPSFQMTGQEREDVPKGAFELDPASLPINLEEIEVLKDLKVDAVNMHSGISFSKVQTGKVKTVAPSEGNTPGCQVNRKTELDPTHISSDNFTEDSDASLPSAEFEIPEPEFFNFDGEKSPEKFQVGQIWALYSDEDGLPKYYAWIKKIDVQPEFKLHITWLYCYSLPKNTRRWRDKKMLSCCGTFKLQKSKAVEYTETGPFSHQLRVEHAGKKDEYSIFPRKGEVWALYKNWNSQITRSDLKACEYDTVEVLEENDSAIKVLVLEMVNGFKSVFKPQMKEGSALTMEISRVELLRFSHQIPAFRLTKERGGSLEGYFELDPAAFPITWFRSS